MERNNRRNLIQTPFGFKWDVRFLEMTKMVASWSKDPSTKCGAVIVRPDKTVCSVGFNGFAKYCQDKESYYSNRDTKYARVIHAEVNAILHSSEKLYGYTIYVYPGSPNISTCSNCAALIIQSGIQNVICEYNEPDDFNIRWKKSSDQAMEMYKEARVQVYTIDINKKENYV